MYEKKLYAKLINNKKDSDLEKFELGHIFKINDILLGQSSTTLYLDLDCEDDLGFNSVYFSILDEKMEPYEILKDKDINKYMYEIEGQGDIYNEFLDILNYNNTKFMLYLYDLLIDVEVTGITVGENENFCKLSIPGGEITVWKENKIEKCQRPDNVIMECKYCFRLFNQYGDYMGYIYVK